MAMYEIPKKEWSQKLVPLLTGKIMYAFQNDMKLQYTEDYEALKEELLLELGLSIEKCRQEYWMLRKATGEFSAEWGARVCRMTKRYTKGGDSIEDVNELLAIGRFLTGLPQATAVKIR